ncbi:hypothetical protein [Sulfitobacter mediterraneus]|uniref:hypothetical protein n=1 Tax=Sulfitobacter mediterraneus TaxID=83219 RepID=UPI0021A5B046|nr:hypothetical protein [Sulfitobacter mediterraneus]UWR10926.1 hypothetical protein K3753_17005 [Sulfitobacter mediterraneus]
MKPPLGFPKIVGMATAGVLKDCLLKRGWTPMMPKGRVHSTVLTRCNRKEIANIYLRRRGIDLQILPEVWVEPPRANTFLDCTLSEGRVVRHFLSQTSFNLFEGILRFAKAFENDEDNYGRFFNSVGSRDRKTADIIGSCEEADDGFDAMLYEALGGDGGSVYIGDGLFMGADGSWHD